jgi:hypothetical protein
MNRSQFHINSLLSSTDNDTYRNVFIRMLLDPVSKIRWEPKSANRRNWLNTNEAAQRCFTKTISHCSQTGMYFALLQQVRKLLPFNQAVHHMQLLHTHSSTGRGYNWPPRVHKSNEIQPGNKLNLRLNGTAQNSTCTAD